MTTEYPPKEATSYAASCNPPRRAKRPRTGSLTDPTKLVSTTSAAVGDRNPSAAASAGNDSEDLGTPVAPPPKRRGRKPSTLSRATRESIRRQNHSRIEKARRTKINDTLAALRALVPACGKVGDGADEEKDEDTDEDEYAEGQKGAGKKGQEKEFKLEVLEKVVAYVKELKEKIRLLEQHPCACGAERKGPRPKTQLPTTRKRRRSEQDEECPEPITTDIRLLDPSSIGVAEGDTRSPHIKRPRMSHTQSARTSQVSGTRLPSISAWLPNPHVDAGLILPDMQRSSQQQLNTPPTSTEFHAVASPSIPPALLLDLPPPSALSRSFATSTSSRVTIDVPTSQSGPFTRTNLLNSPPWTPEDESAASMLLQIKALGSPLAFKGRSSTVEGVEGGIRRVQTPSSLLGIDTKR